MWQRVHGAAFCSRAPAPRRLLSAPTLNAPSFKAFELDPAMDNLEAAGANLIPGSVLVLEWCDSEEQEN